MKCRLRLGSIAILLMFPGAALAHRLDEYLQATRLSLALDRLVLKIDLTPGVEVAPVIFARINTNRDGRISAAEGRAYANQVLNEIVIEMDGRKPHLDLVRSEFPTFEEMRAGVGTIRIEARTTWTLAPGPHWLLFRNNHRHDCGVYLVNALVPVSPEIEITAQQRDPLQREIRVGFRRSGFCAVFRASADRHFFPGPFQFRMTVIRRGVVSSTTALIRNRSPSPLA